MVVGDRNQRDRAWPGSDTCDDFGPIKRLVSNTVSLESIRLGERGVRFAVLSTGHKATARGDDGEAFYRVDFGTVIRSIAGGSRTD